MTPPPATISGRRADRSSPTARASAAGSGAGRGTCQTRSLEQLGGPVERLGLDVLGQRDRRRAGLGLVGQDAHRAEQRGGQLLRAMDPVEEPRHRPERVVDGHVRPERELELLEDGVRDARRERVARQQQDRQPVDRRERGAGDHVRRARPDRRRAGERREPVPHPGERGRGVDHRLLVAGLAIRQESRRRQLGLEQRLPHPGDVAVAEDPEAALDQAVARAVALGVLGGEEPDDRLADGQPDGPATHDDEAAAPSARPNGSRGSTAWSRHASLTQAWAGSSQASHARSPGPAITFR